MANEENVLILMDKHSTSFFRVLVPEDRIIHFEKLMQSNGYRFSKIGEAKQLSLCINLDKVIRDNK